MISRASMACWGACEVQSNVLVLMLSAWWFSHALIWLHPPGSVLAKLEALPVLRTLLHVLRDAVSPLCAARTPFLVRLLLSCIDRKDLLFSADRDKGRGRLRKRS